MSRRCRAGCGQAVSVGSGAHDPGRKDLHAFRAYPRSWRIARRTTTTCTRTVAPDCSRTCDSCGSCATCDGCYCGEAEDEPRQLIARSPLRWCTGISRRWPRAEPPRRHCRWPAAAPPQRYCGPTAPELPAPLEFSLTRRSVASQGLIGCLSTHGHAASSRPPMAAFEGSPCGVDLKLGSDHRALLTRPPVWFLSCFR